MLCPSFGVGNCNRESCLDVTYDPCYPASFFIPGSHTYVPCKREQVQMEFDTPLPIGYSEPSSVCSYILNPYYY